MKNICLLFILSLVTAATAVSQTLSVTGPGCEKRYFTNGALFFTNRSYYIDRIPERFQGYDFLAKGGKTSPELEITVFGSGEIYLIAAPANRPEGWTPVPETEFYYSDDKKTVLSVFSRKVEDGEFIRFPVLTDFPGATLLAHHIAYHPSLPVMEAVGAGIDVASVGSGEPLFLKKTLAFSASIPESIRDKQFTRVYENRGGVEKVRLFGDGEIFVAFLSKINDSEWKSAGTFLCGSQFVYLYKKSVRSGVWTEVPEADGKNGIVISDEIQLLDYPAIPGKVVARSVDSKKFPVTDPCIVILPSGEYVAGCRSAFDGVSGALHLFKSRDRGESWQVLSTILQAGFCNLFTLNDDLYIMGTKGGFNHAVIYKSSDGGETWTNPTDRTKGLLLATGKNYHSASVPVVIHNGRIWRAMEDNIPKGERFFRAFVMSAPIDSDLLDASNWTVSTQLPYETSWISEGGTSFGGWLEGNAVVDPDGNIVNVLRVHEPVNDNKAAIVRISPDGRESFFDPEKDIIDFPGGCKKFVIRYDERTQKYWSLTNSVFDADRELLDNCERIRNNVTLICSDDLRRWEVKDTLLRHADVHYHAFQYLDWQFDGNDIIAVSRTAWDYDKGLPVKQHDANYMSFHRFRNFRNTDSGLHPVYDRKKLSYMQSGDRLVIRSEKIGGKAQVSLYDRTGVLLSRIDSVFPVKIKIPGSDKLLLVVVNHDNGTESKKIYLK